MNPFKCVAAAGLIAASVIPAAALDISGAGNRPRFGFNPETGHVVPLSARGPRPHHASI